MKPLLGCRVPIDGGLRELRCLADGDGNQAILEAGLRGNHKVKLVLKGLRGLIIQAPRFGLVMEEYGIVRLPFGSAQSILVELLPIIPTLEKSKRLARLRVG
jgi:hypothetical protein